MTVGGFGLGLGTAPAMTAAYRTLRPSKVNDAAPQLNIIMRVGGSIGTAILTVVLQDHLTRAGRSLSAQASAFGSTFWWVLVLTAGAIVPPVALMVVERRRTAHGRLGEGRDRPAGHRPDGGGRMMRPIPGPEGGPGQSAGPFSARPYPAPSLAADQREGIERLRHAVHVFIASERRLRGRYQRSGESLSHAHLRALFVLTTSTRPRPAGWPGKPSSTRRASPPWLTSSKLEAWYSNERRPRPALHSDFPHRPGPVCGGRAGGQVAPAAGRGLRRHHRR